MLLQGPSAVVVVPPSTTVLIARIAFNLVDHTFALTYAPSGAGVGQMKTASGAIPAALLTSLENVIKTAIENAENWAAGSSTIQTA